MHHNDDELVTAILSGEIHLFADIVRRFDERLREVIRRRVDDPASVDDLVQATFYRAFTSLEKLSDPHHLEGWLVTIAKNCATDHLRSRARRSEYEFDELSVNQFATPQDWANSNAWIWREVEKLPQSDAEILRLRYQQSLTNKEIAARIGLPLSTIRGRLYEARKTLRKRLENKGLYP